MSARLTFRDAVAALFRQHPGEWISSYRLETVGGRMAWRTRVSDCRLELGMPIDNRQERDDDGRCQSFYRFLPDRLF